MTHLTSSAQLPVNVCAHTNTLTSAAATLQSDHKVTEPVMMSLMPCVSFPFSIMRNYMLVGSQIRIVADYISSVHLIQVS